MRLMQADEAGATALECLYCGARAASTPPYAVMYCDCRSVREEADDASPRTLRTALQRAA